MKHRKLQLLYVLTIRWINFEYSTVSIYGKQKSENLMALRTRLIGSHGWTKGTHIINQWRKDGKIVFLFRSVMSALWDPHISTADAAPPRLLLITPPYRLRNHRACYLNSELNLYEHVLWVDILKVMPLSPCLPRLPWFKRKHPLHNQIYVSPTLSPLYFLVDFLTNYFHSRLEIVWCPCCLAFQIGSRCLFISSYYNKQSLPGQLKADERTWTPMSKTSVDEWTACWLS